jgi:hypothetical protein
VRSLSGNGLNIIITPIEDPVGWIYRTERSNNVGLPLCSCSVHSRLFTALTVIGKAPETSNKSLRFLQ